MTSIKGYQTEKNLLAAFAGESQTRNRYDYFAKVAKKEGYVQIQRIFEETAEQERVHAKNFFKKLQGDDLEIVATFPAGLIGTTEDNLSAAIAGEKHEHTNLYPGFAKVASAEGFIDIAVLFESIAVAERLHERRFATLLQHIKDQKVFKRDRPVSWYCIKCGYVHEGTEPLPKCPACAHSKAYFEILSENW